MRLYAFDFPRFLRIELPRISIRWALWTSRSDAVGKRWIGVLAADLADGHVLVGDEAGR